MRTKSAPPAHVQSDLLLGHVTQRMVDRLHAQLRVTAVVSDAHLGEHLPAVRQVRIVDLQVQTGPGDRLILLVQGIGEREDVLLIGLVVLVVEPVLDRAGRDSRQECVHILALDGGFEVGNVGFDRRLADVRQRTGDDHGRRTAGDRRNTRPITAEPSTTRRKELRKLAQVACIDVARRQLGGCGRIGWLDCLQPLAYIIGEVALAQLAIIDDVDADLHLLANHLLDGR